ncbi:uncharacterized protein [Diadema antillarum]|uniref:uncharacterized protein n=1 Tax=Diadema antillarum TaxID=105358 RepID=UPI003A8B7FC6
MNTDQNDDIPLNSTEGLRLLDEANCRQMLLIRIFRKRHKSGYCGAQSAAMLLSARHFGQKHRDSTQHADCDVSDLPYVDTNLFSYPQTRLVMEEEAMVSNGITLPEMEALLEAHGISSKLVHWKDSNPEEFRDLAMAALSHGDSSRGVLVNFEFDMMWQGKSVTIGHHSLLAAYHSASDRFLLLDTFASAQDRWVRTEKMFQMMGTLDKVSGLCRGFLITGTC